MDSHKTFGGIRQSIGQWLIGDNFKGQMINGMTRTEATQILMKLVRETKALTKKDINDWRRAWRFAISVSSPQRGKLHEIYTDTEIDNHLTGAQNIRLLKLVKRKFNLVDEDTGEINKDATKLITRGWFREFIRLASQAKYWGHSLIEFGDIIDGEFKEVHLVLRDHVKPELGIVTVSSTDLTGFSFKEPPLSDWTIEVGKSDDLGLLLKASPQAISKKNMTAFWDEFGEIFGIPIRIVKTPTRDKQERSSIEAMLEQMGSSAWGLFPEGTDIEIKEASQRDAWKVFDARIERANSEMSKLILGATMIMDDGSSLSQSQTHEQVAADIVEADGDEFRDLVNDKLLPFLIKHGYQIEGLKFMWDNKTRLTFEQQLEVDIWLTENFNIPTAYYEETYGVEIESIKENAPPSFENFMNRWALKKKIRN